VLLATQAHASVEGTVRPYFPSPGWLDRWVCGTQHARYLLLRLLIEAFTPKPSNYHRRGAGRSLSPAVAAINLPITP
jgi:hypothetical protein